MGVLKSKRGKSDGGTQAHKNLALAYAKWLDPKLHILINEVFFQRIEEEKNPDLIADRYIKAYKKRGKDEKWIQERFEGKVVRNTFTSTLAKHGVKHDGFRQCTNAIYSPLFGGKTDVIRQKKNLPEKANIRDNLSRLELMSVKFAEELASENIKNNNLQGNNECAKASFIASNAVKDCVLKSRQKINQTNMGKISITYNGESILIESGKKNLTITAEQAYYLKEMLSDIDSKYNLRPQIQNK